MEGSFNQQIKHHDINENKIPTFFSFQDELNQHREIEQSELRELEASQGYCSKYKMQKMKENVKETKQLIESLSRTPPSSSKTPVAAQTEEFKCLVCLNLPLENVFICTECEGTLCDACKTQLEHIHEQSGRNERLNCPQCRANFVSPGNPIRSRKTERLIQNLLQQ